MQAVILERGGSFGGAPACIWPLHAPDLVLVGQEVGSPVGRAIRTLPGGGSVHLNRG